MRNDDGTNLPILNFLSKDSKTIKSYTQTIPVSLYHFYITDEIEEVDPYLDLINILKTAEVHDTVFIYLNSPGGNLSTAIQVISAIKQSNAHVVTSLEGVVASAASLIFLSGHKFIVNPNCTLMIHNYSSWASGKGNELALQVKYNENYFKKLAKDIYGGFLTVAEIQDVLAGKDLWLDSEDVLQRLRIEHKDATKDAEALLEKITPVKKKKKKTKR